MKKSDLDGVYKFLSHSYHGNWQNRWGSTPFMSKFSNSESILGHMWACMEFWFQIKGVFPELNKVVNSELLYEIIMNHDLGETYSGDVSMTRQINGEGSNKKLTERDQISSLVSTLDQKTQEVILRNFDDFEEDINNTSNIEVLVAKFIDTLQGDQFALIFGNDLVENSELIDKIISLRFTPYAKRLIDVLKVKHEDAAKEVIQIANHHLEQIRLAGIKISANDF
ncbi:MAG: HD domain-containing protein [Microgenomates group bacterium]